MNLKEACKHALTILKQVMEEKLNETNVEVRFPSEKIWRNIKEVQNDVEVSN